MQIDSIPKIAPAATEWTAQQRQPKPETTAASAPAYFSSSLASAQASAPQTPDAANSVQVSALAAGYSTTVGGKNYPLSIEKAGATFVASVPNPPGASATGSSIQAAENNLDIKLDTLA